MIVLFLYGIVQKKKGGKSHYFAKRKPHSLRAGGTHSYKSREVNETFPPFF